MWGVHVIELLNRESGLTVHCLPSVLFWCVPCAQLHEFDELRFDVRTQDCSYFLRTTTVEEKAEWVEAIEVNKVQPCIYAQVRFTFIISLSLFPFFMS